MAARTANLCSIKCTLCIAQTSLYSKNSDEFKHLIFNSFSKTSTGVMSGAPCPPVLVRKVLQAIPSMENILVSEFELCRFRKLATHVCIEFELTLRTASEYN